MGRWRGTGRPRMLQSMWSQRVGHNWETEHKHTHTHTLWSLCEDTNTNKRHSLSTWHGQSLGNLAPPEFGRREAEYQAHGNSRNWEIRLWSYVPPTKPSWLPEYSPDRLLRNLIVPPFKVQMCCLKGRKLCPEHRDQGSASLGQAESRIPWNRYVAAGPSSRPGGELCGAVGTWRKERHLSVVRRKGQEETQTSSAPPPRRARRLWFHTTSWES